MRLGNKAIFKDQGKLTTMFNLRRNGLSFASLAVLYHCDPSSLRNQCDKYGVVPLTDVYTIHELIKPILIKKSDTNEKEYRIEDGIRINRGKNYEDYLREFIRLKKGREKIKSN